MVLLVYFKVSVPFLILSIATAAVFLAENSQFFSQKQHTKQI